MKLKLLILKGILILSFFSNNSFAKNLPPGSGISDVPANVLILLDKSGSMSVRMTSGDGFSYPYSVATDSSGDVYVGQYWIRGIKKMTYSTKKNDTSFGSNGIYRGSGNCRSYYPMNMKVHNNKLYVASFINIEFLGLIFQTATVIGAEVYDMQEMFRLHKILCMGREIVVW